MTQALQAHCGDVTALCPAPGGSIGGKILNRVARQMCGRRYDYGHTVSAARKYARYMENRLAEGDYDVIFAPASSTAVAFLNSPLPLVYASDATFRLLHNYYPEYSNLLARSVREGECIEQAAIKNAAVALYSSQWAADSAVRDYAAAQESVRVVPFGANLDFPPGKDEVVPRNGSGRVRLLFVAVNWLRKGGDIARDTLVKLLEMGVDAELIVCGCTPPAGSGHERLTVIPFLDKNDPSQRQALAELYLSADCLVLPTRHDCTPIVFCEANAYGLPVVTCDTGGVSGVIRDGVNGYLLPSGADGAQYAAMIAVACRGGHRFAELRDSSRKAYEERLNWDAWGGAVRGIIEDVLENRERSRV
jgi:glycosyltransferase involved in cell wall biosynthesis